MSFSHNTNILDFGILHEIHHYSCTGKNFMPEGTALPGFPYIPLLPSLTLIPDILKGAHSSLRFHVFLPDPLLPREMVYTRMENMHKIDLFRK